MLLQKVFTPLPVSRYVEKFARCDLTPLTPSLTPSWFLKSMMDLELTPLTPLTPHI